MCIHAHAVLVSLNSVSGCLKTTYLTISLQKTEYGDFIGSIATAFAFALPTKITFIGFYFAIKHFQMWTVLINKKS